MISTQIRSARLRRRRRERREQGQRRRGRRARLGAVDEHYLAARAGNGQPLPVQLDPADLRVVERLATVHPLDDAVLLPEPSEELGPLAELRNERLDPRVRSPPRMPHPERRDQAGPVPLPGAKDLPDLGVEEDEARHVPLLGWAPLESYEQGRGGRVPGEQVEPGPDDEGRQWIDG